MKQSPTALHEFGAADLVAGYRRREFSPVDVARSVLGHVERWEHHLQALFLLKPEQVMEQARASEERWLRGAPLGLIDGVPVTIKDNIATQGDPTPPCSRTRAAGGASAGAGASVVAAVPSGVGSP